MIYWAGKEHGLKVKMSESIWKRMCKLCTEGYPNECGGILVGQYSNDLKKAEIKEIMISKNSAGAKVTFLREAREANNFLRCLWRLASGTKYFIGEWHSHPNGNGVPSGMDDSAMYRIAKSKKCSCRRPVLIIVSGSPKSWQSNKCWIYLEEDIRLELSREN